jgi:hypothetical protein
MLVLDAYGRGVQTLTPLLKEAFSVHVSRLQQLKTLIHNIQKGKYIFFFFFSEIRCKVCYLQFQAQRQKKVASQ